MRPDIEFLLACVRAAFRTGETVTLPEPILGATIVARRHFDAARMKVHPTMNENLREYYGKIQQHFKGGLPEKVQPPEYQ